MKQQGVKFPAGIDKAGKGHGATATAYKAKKLPAVYVIDGDGNVRYQDLPVGAVERAVENLASGN
jgi:hypothetical protein